MVAQPAQLGLAAYRIVHTLTGALRSIVPAAIAVIPHPRAHTLLLAVVEEAFHAVALDILIPAAIDETTLPAEGGGEVDIGNLVVVVDAGVLPDNPRPCVARTLIVYAGFIERFHHIPGDGGLHDGLQRSAESERSPRGDTDVAAIGRCFGIGESHLCTCAAEAVVLTFHGEGDGHEAVGRGVAEVAGAVVAGGACLGDEEPMVFSGGKVTAYTTL